MEPAVAVMTEQALGPPRSVITEFPTSVGDLSLTIEKGTTDRCRLFPSINYILVDTQSLKRYVSASKALNVAS